MVNVNYLLLEHFSARGCRDKNGNPNGVHDFDSLFNLSLNKEPKIIFPMIQYLIKGRTLVDN